jgi:hypothetical protein
VEVFLFRLASTVGPSPCGTQAAGAGCTGLPSDRLGGPISLAATRWSGP